MPVTCAEDASVCVHFLIGHAEAARSIVQVSLDVSRDNSETKIIGVEIADELAPG
jgi:hypothetical protein